MTEKLAVLDEALDGRGLRIAIVASRFHREIVDHLVETALDELRGLRVSEEAVAIYRVPGAFELPLAALAVLRRVEPPDAVICLGAVIRGETPHFDFVAAGAAEGILRVGLDTGRPVIFGVLTTDTVEQAWDRAAGRVCRGRDAARDAVAMARLLEQVAGSDPRAPDPARTEPDRP